MSNQSMSPFKAKFILEVSTTSNEFFQNPEQETLKSRLSRVSDDLGNAAISDLIKYFYLSFNSYKLYENLHLKYHKAFDVNPSSMTVDSRIFDMSFKLESYEVEVLQILDNKITFTNSNNEVHTIETSDKLKLIKV